MTFDNVTIEQAVKQIEKHAFTTGTKGNRIPEPKRIADYIDGLDGIMQPDDWQKLLDMFAEWLPTNHPLHPGGNTSTGKVGRPPGKYHGMTTTERRAAQQAECDANGWWHIKFRSGCRVCKRKRYAHRSMGVCTRCAHKIASCGLTVRQFLKDQ
jgi:hypothetical protein